MVCEPALAAGVAIVAAGVTWYLNPTVSWRWCQQRRTGLLARSAVVLKRALGVTSATPATDSERCLSSSSKLSACDADANPRRTPNDILAAQGAKPELAPEDPRTDEGRSSCFSAARDTEPERGFRFCPLASDGNAKDPNTARMPRVAGAAVQASDDAPPDFLGTHLLALPDEVLVLVLVSRAGNVNARRAGRVLADAGACCKSFASIVDEAATVFAGHHGWRLESLAGGGMPSLRHLSKLAQDTRRVHYQLRQQPTTHGSGRFRHLAFVDLWVTEMSRGFIGPLLIDAQVRRQHTLELGAYLIKLAMDSRGDPVGKMLQVCAQLEGMMMQPDSPLDASWLAAHVRVPPVILLHSLEKAVAYIQQSDQQGRKFAERGVILKVWLLNEPRLNTGHTG